MQPDQTFVLLLLVALLTGCTGSGTTVSYDASMNQTTYQTDDIVVARDVSDDGFGNTPLKMKAVAYCRGQRCMPQGARLFFFVNDDSGVSFSDQTITLVSDGQSFTWSNWRVQPGNAQRGDDYIAQISVSLGTLERFARASSFSGSLAGTPLDLGRPVQSLLYEFVQTIKRPGQ